MDNNLDTLTETLHEIITTTRSKRRNTIFPRALEKLKQQKAELIKLKNQSCPIENENADLETLKNHPSLLTSPVPITGVLKSNKNLNGGHQDTDSRSKSDHYVNRKSNNNRPNSKKTSAMVSKSVRSSPNRKVVVKSKTPEPNKSKWGVNERNRKLNTRPKSADRNPRTSNIVRGSKQRARSSELSPKTKLPNKEMRGRSPFKKDSRIDNKADCMQQCSSKEIIVISRPQTPCSDRDSRIAINLRNISSNSQVRLSLDANQCQNRATPTLQEGECQCLIEDLKDEIKAYRENAEMDCCRMFTPIRVEISSKREPQQKVVTEPKAACDYLDRLKEEIFKYRKLATDHEVELAEIRKEIQDYRENCLRAPPPCELPKVPEESATSSLSHTDENVTTPEIPTDEAGSSIDKITICSENSNCVCADYKKAGNEPKYDHYIMTEENVTPEIPSDEAGSSSDKMSIRSDDSSCICADGQKAKIEPERDHYIMTEESMQSKKEGNPAVEPCDQEVLEDVEKTTSNDEILDEQIDEDIPIEQAEENGDCKESEDQDDKEDIDGDDKETSDDDEEEAENAMKVKTNEVKSEGIESRTEDCECDGYKNGAHLQKEEEESPQAKTDVDPELRISFRSPREFAEEEEEEEPQTMIWTTDAAAAAATHSSSEGALQGNVVEKQIEEANKLIERVMSALREIKLGITQYKTGPNMLSVDSPNVPSRPGCPLKEISTPPCTKKSPQPKSPTVPTKRCRSPPKYQARPQKCTPFTYDRPIPKTEVSNQRCSVCNTCGHPHTPKASCNRYTCAHLGVVSASMPKKQLKGEKPLVDEETDPTLRPFPVGDGRPKTRRGACRAPCTIELQTQSYNPEEKEPPVATDEPSYSMEALKAKLSTISEPSETSSDHSSKKSDVKEDAKDASSKLLPLKLPNSSGENNTADKLVQRCVKCLKSGMSTRDCICAKILGVLSVSHQAPVSNIKPSASPDGKKDRLQVQNIPPVSIRSGLVVQKVLDLAIKPTGSTDAVVDKTDNIKYEEIMEETGDPESLGKRLSFMSEGEKQCMEERKMASAQSYSLPSPQSSSSTKLSVLQSFQVLPHDMLRVDIDTPDLSTISGNVNIDVYKTYIDPYAEIMSATDEDDQREQQEVKLSRIRRPSMKSSGVIKARLSQEDPLRSKEKRPTDPEETSIQMVEREISVQKLTDQEREQPLELLGMTVEAEKDRPVTAPAAFGLKSPFEIGLYDNKSIQCGSSYIPTLKNDTRMQVSLSSSIGSNSSSRSPAARYHSASIQADGSLEEDSSSVTVSNGSEDSTAETANKALQVSFSSSSESSSSGTEVASEQVSFSKNKNMKYNVSYMEDVKRNETVDNFLTGLTEQSAKSIDMFQKSHGNLEERASNMVGSVPSGYGYGYDPPDSVSTLDLDENAAMLKNLVHDPNRRKKSSSKPATPTLSSNIPSETSKSGRNPPVHCCQVEYNDVDMWKPMRLSDYNITRENVETSTHRQTCSGSEKNIQKISRHASSFRNSPREHSASDPETLSNEEYRCRCSISSGEIHVCPFGRDMRNKVKYLKKHPERFLRKELGDSKLKILSQRRFYNHWVSYYIQLDSSRNNTSISTNSDENHMI